MGSFDSLRYRNYRVFWIGAFLSNVGTWMQNIALGWYVLLLTHSAFWVSFVTFANLFPIVLSPIGGVYTDRMNRKRILLVTQSVMLVDAAILAVLVWTGHAPLWAVLLLTFGLGTAFAFNAPTWLAFVPSLVPPEAMVNAIALNSAQFSAARVVGPALAGVLLTVTGASLIFGLNALSFVAVLVALALIRVPAVAVRPRHEVTGFLRSGFAYTWRNLRLRTMILSIAVFSFFTAPITALLPVFAADVFHGGSGTYGALAVCMGLGAVVGALTLGRLGNRITPRAVAVAMLATAFTMVLFAVIPVFGLGLGLMVAYGATNLFTVAATNGDIQLHVEESYRGRVMSIYMLAFGAMFPVGSLVAGAAAEHLGVGPVTVVGAVACAVWAGRLLLRWNPGPAAARPSMSPGI